MQQQVTGIRDGLIKVIDEKTTNLQNQLLSVNNSYCERQFMSKETFNTVMVSQSSERNTMKAELIDRFNRLDDQMATLKNGGK